MYFKLWYVNGCTRPITIVHGVSKRFLELTEFITHKDRFKAIIIKADSREEAIIKSKSVELKWENIKVHTNTKE